MWTKLESVLAVVVVALGKAVVALLGGDQKEDKVTAAEASAAGKILKDPNSTQEQKVEASALLVKWRRQEGSGY